MLVAATFPAIGPPQYPQRAIPLSGYRAAGAVIAPENSWPGAPEDTLIFGLKELPDDGTPLKHRHIMFGHAFKGQPAGQVLLRRFRHGGGTLLDLEYLTDDEGRRLAAFKFRCKARARQSAGSEGEKGSP
mgnify:CR=1 FL=1